MCFHSLSLFYVLFVIWPLLCFKNSPLPLPSLSLSLAHNYTLLPLLLFHFNTDPSDLLLFKDVHYGQRNTHTHTHTHAHTHTHTHIYIYIYWKYTDYRLGLNINNTIHMYSSHTQTCVTQII